MAGENGAIWQVQASAGDGTESTANGASANNVLLFNASTKVIGDGGAYITDIKVDFRRAVPENEAVDSDNNEIQDMGIDGLDVTITAIGGKTNDDAATNPVNKLSLWLQNGNTTTLFTKGRYGLRLDNAPQWNVVPTSALGFHITNVNFTYLGERKQMAQLIIQMALGGDITTAI